MLRDLSRAENARNAALLCAVTAPWAYGIWYHAARCPAARAGEVPPPLADTVAALDFCGAVGGARDPLVAVNVYFGAVVCGLIWAVSVAIGSTWLIDPLWTVIPLLVNYTYALNPLAGGAAGSPRAMLAEGILLVWSARLTHSYFRRERWNFGAREDWRFDKFRREYPSHWWWMQLFVCFASQQIFLVGITAPLYTLYYGGAWRPPIGPLDGLAAVVALSGVALAGFADTQLHAFVTRNERLDAAGLPRVQILDTGVWAYSRRPNYVGEQMMWWGFALLGLPGAGFGNAWVLLGTAVNSACLFSVTRMVEERMRARPERRAAFERYAERTPMWIGLPRKTAD